MRPERGSAMVVVMIIIAALLAGAAVLVSIGASSANATDVTNKARSGLYCAESGLALSRATIMANRPWAGNLGTGVEPAWLSMVNHDIDGDSKPDFKITLRDNDDEALNDPTTDNDETVFIESTCIKNAEVKPRVTELVAYNGGSPIRKLWLRDE